MVRSRCRKRSLDGEDVAQTVLVDCADSVSECLESTCTGTVILDLSGTEKLFGSSENVARKISASDHEAERLASLCVGLLPITPEMIEILNGWGIQTFKALAALPEIPLTGRLGQAGLYLQKLAQGRIKRTLIPVETASTFVESYEFDDPVELLESLAFLLHRLIQQITERLISHSR
jgi:hypothetical protein